MTITMLLKNTDQRPPRLKAEKQSKSNPEVLKI